MITTLDTYMKKEEPEVEHTYKYYEQPGVLEESTSKTKARKEGYAFEPTKEIAKWIRKDLKDEFGKTIKFSVTSGVYPREICVRIKQISMDHIMKFEDFKEHMICSYNFGEEYYDDYLSAYSTMKFKKYHLISETYEKIQSIINKYNYDNSDPYTDYFDVNYYDSFDIASDVVVLGE